MNYRYGGVTRDNIYTVHLTSLDSKNSAAVCNQETSIGSTVSLGSVSTNITESQLCFIGYRSIIINDSKPGSIYATYHHGKICVAEGGGDLLIYCHTENENTLEITSILAVTDLVKEDRLCGISSTENAIVIWSGETSARR